MTARKFWFHRSGWKRDFRMFVAGSGIGVLFGALIVFTVLWRYNLAIVAWPPPTTFEDDAGVVRIGERPAATTGRAAVSAAAPKEAERSVIGPAPSSPGELKARSLLIPVDGVKPEHLTRQFDDARGTRSHQALDILAPRNTPVRAVEDGKIARLFYSKAGGITVYQFDPSETFSYYYAHLERYADGLREGQTVRKGDILGYVGTSGNAPNNTPHLHFAIFRLNEAKQWWEGTPIDPYDVLR